MAIKMTEQEFNVKYELYAQQLFNISYGYVRNVQNAEDIVQNCFIKLLENKKDFKTVNDEKYWLIRVCINECINFVKSSHQKKVILANELIFSTSDQQQNVKEEHQLLLIVSSLPEKYRVVIICYYYDQLKCSEISHLLGISEATVRKRLERARDMIKTKMEVYDER